MSSEIEAGGAVFTAGLAAAVIDGAGKHGHAGHGPCPNCGAEIAGNFCAACGQPAHTHRTLGHMIEEFFHGVIHFDSRAWKTLPLLLFRPGTLTHNYIHGKRARYISPLAMFLLAVFAMFFVFAFTGGARVGTSDPEASVAAGREIDRAASQGHGAANAGAQQDGYEQVRKGAERGDIVVHTGWASLDDKIAHKLENPELAVYKLQNAAYKFAFLLAPISLPFVWLLFFWKRGMTLFDHTVYILYSLSFVSLLFIGLSLASMIPGVVTWTWPLWLLAGPVHSFFHLKGGYGLGWFSALWRMPILLVFAGICLLAFFLAILAVGLMG
jgi:energy-coupling factor transporter transmembrane protein EcfT